MAQWTDQEPFEGRTVFSVFANGTSVEVERGAGVYRVTAGNLLGSESVRVTCADAAFEVLAIVLDKHAKPLDRSRAVQAIPGFIRLEWRDRAPEEDEDLRKPPLC